MTLKTTEILETILYPAFGLIKPDPAGPEGAPGARTSIFGFDAELDSVALLSFIATVEERVESMTGRRLSLVNPQTMALKDSPFRTLGTLAEYIEKALEQ